MYRMKLLPIGWAALAVLTACKEGKSAPETSAPAERPALAAEAGAAKDGKGKAAQASKTKGGSGGDMQGMRLVPLTVHDPMINNMAAFTILVPKGWTHQAEVQWRHNTSTLVSASVILGNPANGDQLQIFPTIPYAWIPNAVIPMAVGTNYMGNEIRPPMDPAALIRELALPAFRGQARNARVLGTKQLPDVAREVHRSYYNNDQNTRIAASKVSVAYEMGGQAFEEDFYCAASYVSNPMMPGAMFWKPEFVYSFRSFQGGLKAVEGLLQASIFSVNLDKKWFAQYLYVRQLQQQGQMQAIRSAGELSRYISGVNNEINDMITGSYKSQQQSQDRIYNQFSESVRGVETYDNPVTGRPVQLPSDYRNAWVSTSGEYFLSNGETDPNVGSTANWQKLQASP